MAKKKPTEMPLRLEWRTPEELSDNPANWRLHPDAQVAGLDGLLTEVGWAGAALYNEATGKLVDGHLRKKVDPARLIDGKMPVLVGSWTEEQEQKILAALDPLAGMAEVNQTALAALVQGLASDLPDLQAVFDGLLEQATIPVIVAPDEFQNLDPDNLPTDYRCPQCRYEWSGQPKPGGDVADLE